VENSYGVTGHLMRGFVELHMDLPAISGMETLTHIWASFHFFFLQGF